MNSCLHCEINQAISEWTRQKHESTGHRVEVTDVISALVGCMAEVIAMSDDPKMRKYLTKDASRELASQVMLKRVSGVYPGAPGQSFS